MHRLPPGGVVVFDAVGTLLRPEPSVAESYAAAGRRFGSKLTRNEIDTAFRSVFAAEKESDLRAHDGRTNEPRERDRWRMIVAGVFRDVPSTKHDALFDELWNHFAAPSSWRTFDDTQPTLARLAAAGQSIAIASNFDSRLLTIAAELVPEIPSARVFVSSLVGRRKPSAGFFRACETKLRELGLDANSPTLIGDDLHEDYYGARDAGWNAVLLDRDDRHLEVTPRIRSLNDLA